MVSYAQLNRRARERQRQRDNRPASQLETERNYTFQLSTTKTKTTTKSENAMKKMKKETDGFRVTTSPGGQHPVNDDVTQWTASCQ